MAMRPLTFAALIAGASVLSSCGGSDSKAIAERYEPINMAEAGTFQVNGYLWQATLEVLRFMPFASTDSAGGTIVTDWYTNPQTSDERMKVRVNIVDSKLRADVLHVAVSRQLLGQNGQWVDVPVQQSTVAGIEDAILARARQIRILTVTN